MFREDGLGVAKPGEEGAQLVVGGKALDQEDHTTMPLLLLLLLSLLLLPKTFREDAVNPFLEGVKIAHIVTEGVTVDGKLDDDQFVFSLPREQLLPHVCLGVEMHTRRDESDPVVFKVAAAAA